MDHHELQPILDFPAVRLVPANNAPLVLGFLHRVFKPHYNVSRAAGQIRAAHQPRLRILREASR